MQNNITTIYFAGHVGPFSVYPTAAYAITLATSRDKLAMPKWRNNILVQAPDAPDDNAVAVAPHDRRATRQSDPAVRRSCQFQGLAASAGAGAGMSTAGGLTVLVCDSDHTASKAYACQPDGSWNMTSDYDLGFRFRPMPHECRDLHDFSEVVEIIRETGNAVIVRGELDEAGRAALDADPEHPHCAAQERQARQHPRAPDRSRACLGPAGYRRLAAATGCLSLHGSGRRHRRSHRVAAA